MDKLDINTLEGWTKLADKQMRLHLLEHGIDPTLEAIQQGHKEAREKCDQWALEEQEEKTKAREIARIEEERLKAVAEEVRDIFMKSYMSDLPMAEFEAICKLLNSNNRIKDSSPNHWNIGAIYQYGVMQGKRSERSRRANDGN